MADEQKRKLTDPLIIAMKGHPGTGKSTLARSLASSLKIPLIDKDDIRDRTFFLQNDTLSVPPKLLNDMSYHVVWQIASTQLHLGISVIIDTPLSRRTHLDQLVRVASSSRARLLIIECKPVDVGEWRRRLERRGAGHAGGGSWHKPSTWQDIERLLEEYGGCTEYDVVDVPKLVLDTTAGDGFEKLVSSALEFIISHAHAYSIVDSE